MGPVIPTSNQDGHQTKNRKKGDAILKESSPLKLLSQFQQYFSYIVAVSFIGGGNRSTRKKTLSDLSQVTDKLYHIMLYRVHLVVNGFELTTLVVIGTDCTGKSNYYTITTMTTHTL